MRSRQFFVVLGLAACAVSSFAAQPATTTKAAAEKSATATAAVHTLAQQVNAASQAQLAPVTISAIFAALSDVHEVRDASGMVSITPPNSDVIMVHISADGARTHSCVNNEAAAAAVMAADQAPKSQKD